MTEAAPAAGPPAGVAFGDVQRVLALFAQGLAGRPLHLQPLPAHHVSRGSHRHITTDGVVLQLPERLADFESEQHNLGAYRIAVLHQLGYLDGGTFDFDLAVAARRMSLPEVKGPGGPLSPASPLERFFLLGARPALLRRLFVTLEDWRIDLALRRHYPGARADLDRVLAHVLANRPALSTMRPLAALIESLVRQTLGQAPPESWPHAHGDVHVRIRDAALAVTDPAATVYDSARAALDVTAMLEPLIRRPPALRTASGTPVEPGAAPANEVAGETGRGLQDEAAEGVAEPSAGDIDGPGIAFRGEFQPDQVYLRRRGQGGSVAQQGVRSAAGLDHAAPAKDPPGAWQPTPPSPAAAPLPATEGPRSWLYDEWDYQHRCYLKAWCRVHEQRLSGGDGVAFIEAVRRRHARLESQVKRSFAQIRPDAWHRVHHAADGDELELDALIASVIDRRTGQAGEEQFHLRRDRAVRDVAAAFLMDMSASTDFPVPDGGGPCRPGATATPQPAAAAAVDADDDDSPYFYAGGGSSGAVPPLLPLGRRVIDVAKDALALMCLALHALGDRHAVYGFSGEGRDNVEFLVAKEFGDALSGRTWNALAAMQPRGSTRMGPAIRHALNKLARQPERLKLLLIVSDGYPQDQGYGPDRNDEEYGIQDTARALQEAQRAGVVAFCLTIDPAGHDYLRRMCAPQRYLVIDEVATLPAALGQVYQTLTA